MSSLPPICLKADGTVGLYVYYDEARAGEFQECLEADEVEFSCNPPEAAPLAVPGKAVFVFGQAHPRTVAKELEKVGEEVMIDPDVVITEDLYQPPARQLLSLDEPSPDETQDYLALGLSLNDVSPLIQMATDDQLHAGSPDSPVVWAPVHAWRALAQLRAAEAVAPLVELFRRAEEWDEWVSDDLPKALAQFGAAALAPVAAYLANVKHGEWARIAAARTLGHLGEEHPDCRLDCIAYLSAQLDRFAEQSENLNASLVSPLWDLKAVEAMPVIERAFASGRVDEAVLGDVEDVQIHFGLKTQREHPPKPNKLTILGEQIRARWLAAGLSLPDANGNFPEPEPDPPPLDLPPSAAPYFAPPKVGRNDPCPCGSGRKFKKCCGG